VQFLGRVGVIALQQTVEFTGAQPLTIAGNNATLDGSEIVSGPAFSATGGGDLSVSSLTVRQAPAEGIAVVVPSTATGTIRVSLFKVDILNNLGHGVLVNDQEDPSTTEEVQPDPDGSAASVSVRVVNSRFMSNGYTEGASDLDGLRVNEGGLGDLIITIKHSVAQDNGADGIEVDERGPGDVLVDMMGSQVNGNGSHDPADLDDGFDIDEYDDGSIIGLIFQTTANDNFEEGFDFNENNAGDLRVDMKQVQVNGNREEGIDYEEDDDFAGGGDLVTKMSGITANGNGADGGDAGLKIREKGVGNLDATVDHVVTSNNLIGGIQVREDAEGSLVSAITHATSVDNASHGIDFDENAEGNLSAAVTKSTSSTNGGAGVRADEAAAGTGSLVLSKVTLEDNAGGATSGNVPQIVP
jgi:hypothetical protein